MYPEFRNDREKSRDTQKFTVVPYVLHLFLVHLNYRKLSLVKLEFL